MLVDLFLAIWLFQKSIIRNYDARLADASRFDILKSRRKLYGFRIEEKDAKFRGIPKSPQGFSWHILAAFGFASMWLAVFADVGVSVIAILNAMRAMMVKK